MKLTAEVVYGFSQWVLASRFDSPKPTPAFHMDLWRLCCSDHKYVAVAAPRGHAKSTSVTLAYLLAAVLFRSKKYAIIISDTEGQAKDFLQNIIIELKENDILREQFKISHFHKDNEADIIVVMGEDNHKFRILAKGSGQRIRGRLWAGTRPDLIIGDDLENDDIVSSTERRDKFRLWFYNAVLPSLSDTGEIRIVGTILHTDSLLERLMPKEDKKNGIKLINTPLADYTDEKAPMWKSVRFRAHGPDFSPLLWPERFTPEFFRKLKAEYTKQGFPEGYSQEYLNYPIDESTSYFRVAYMKSMEEKHWKQNLIYYVGGDFAISKATKADYTALVIVGVNSDGEMFVVDSRRGRWDTFEIVQEIINIQQSYKPALFVFEKGSIWSAVEPVLLKETYKPGRTLNVNYTLASATHDKTVKARPLQHRMRAGMMYFDKDAYWFPEFETELVRFPKAQHDDQVDALGHVCSKILELQDAPTDTELEEEEFQEFNKSLRLISGGGRSTWSGY